MSGFDDFTGVSSGHPSRAGIKVQTTLDAFAFFGMAFIAVFRQQGTDLVFEKSSVRRAQGSGGVSCQQSRASSSKESQGAEKSGGGGHGGVKRWNHERALIVNPKGLGQLRGPHSVRNLFWTRSRRDSDLSPSLPVSA